MDYVPTDGLRPYALFCACLFLSLNSHTLLASGRSDHSVSLSAVPYTKKLWPIGNYPNGEGETSIANDLCGQHVVVVCFDGAGFGKNLSNTVSFMVSEDYGGNFSALQPLPCEATVEIEGTAYPRLLGHPEVRYAGHGVFVCVAAMARPTDRGGTVQTLAMYRSTDFGRTWKGPVEIPSATNPRGQYAGANALETADKPSIDVSSRGRVIVGWTNFTPVGDSIQTEICAAYSDDLLKADNPHWSARTVIATGTASFENGSTVRFGEQGTGRAMIVWNSRAFGANEKYSVSSDNGTSWSTPRHIRRTDFTGPDAILGAAFCDPFPSLAVNLSANAGHGDIYVVYADNSSLDGGDIAFQSSHDQDNFCLPVFVNSRPGSDRAQWAPSIAVDPTNGRIHVTYFDQSAAPSGDLTQVMHTMSDDGGKTWTPSVPIGAEPFHAAYTTNMLRANLGEYNQIAALSGSLLAALSVNNTTTRFDDCLQGLAHPHIDLVGAPIETVPIRLADLTYTDSHAAQPILPGESVSFKVSLQNYATTAIGGASVIKSVKAGLSSQSDGINVTSGAADFGDILPGSTLTNWLAFTFSVSRDFAPGAKAHLSLKLQTASGERIFPLTFSIGNVNLAPIFGEDFGGTAISSLPLGWQTQHFLGKNEVKWSVATLPDGTKALYHANANDGVNHENARVESVSSPIIRVPKDAEQSVLEFDIAYNTEDEPKSKVLAYDGCFLSIADSNSEAGMSVPVQSFANEITATWQHGSRSFYPRQIYSAFGTYGVWGGQSNGTEHVRVKMDGLSGRSIRLQWNFLQDATLTGSDSHPLGARPGVFVSNIKLYAASSKPQPVEIKSISLDRYHPAAGNEFHGTLTMTAPVLQDTRVRLSSDVGPVILPAEILLKAKSSSATFIISSSEVDDRIPARLSASVGASNASADFEILPSHLRIANPICRDQAAQTTSDSLLSVSAPGVLKNARSADDAGLDAVLVKSPKFGSLALQPNGSFDYQPSSGFTGSDTFTFRAYEGNSQSQVMSVTIRVVSAQPNAREDSMRWTCTPSQPSQFTHSDSPDGPSLDPVALKGVVLEPSEVVGGHRGSGVVVLSDEAYSGAAVSLAVDRPDLASVPETVAVGEGASSGVFAVDTARVLSPSIVNIRARMQSATTFATILILPAGTPVAKDDLYTVNQDTKLFVSSADGVLLNDIPSAATDDSLTGAFASERHLSAGQISFPKHGVVRMRTDGSFVYSPDHGYVGMDEFRYKFNDGIAESEPATARIIVEPLVTAVRIKSEFASTGSPVTGTVFLTGPAPGGGMDLTLSSNAGETLLMPSTVHVPGGRDQAQFVVVPNSLVSSRDAIISAGANGVAKSATVRLGGIAISELTMADQSIEGAAESSGIIVFNSPVAESGMSVNLSTDHPEIVHLLVNRMRILPSYSFGTFLFKTENVRKETRVNITVTIAGSQKTSTITLRP